MKTTLKLIALLLCLVMLVPCIVACQGGGDGEGDGTGDATVSGSGDGDGAEDSSESESEVQTDREGNVLAPEVGLDTYTDLEGYTYKAYVRGSESGNGAFLCEDFWVKEFSEDPLQYAVYARNTDIENEYNCKIKQVDSKLESQYDEMKNFYLSDERYELGIVLAMDAAICATAALLLDVYSLENIKLENATYDQNSVEQFTMGGKLYYFSGDMNISPLDSASVTIFNTKLHKDYDFEKQLGGDVAYNDPYKMVEDDDWTVENMLKMAGMVNQDKEGDGGVLDATLGDTVGYYQYSASAQYYWFGCGARLSELEDIEDGGYPAIAFNNETGKEVFDLLYKSLNTAVENPTLPCGGSDKRKDNYATGKTLFTDIILWDIRKVYHPAEYKYGILPVPKFDKDQDRYFDVVYYPYETAHLWTVPAMCENKDYASFVLNVMAVHSARIDNTMDAYYTKTLELSVAQDAGSRATLKIVRDNVTYDICLLYDWGDFLSGTLSPLHGAASNRYSEATTASQIAFAEEEMNTTLLGFREPALPDNEE